MSAVDRVTSKNKDLTILCQVLCHFFKIIIKCVYILAEDHDMNESFLRVFLCFKFNVNKLFQLNESWIAYLFEDIKGMQNFNNHSYT